MKGERGRGRDEGGGHAYGQVDKEGRGGGQEGSCPPTGAGPGLVHKQLATPVPPAPFCFSCLGCICLPRHALQRQRVAGETFVRGQVAEPAGALQERGIKKKKKIGAGASSSLPKILDLFFFGKRGRGI